MFVCQNNLYGEMTSVDQTMTVDTIAERSAAYGFAGVGVDADDPDRLCEALEEAAKWGRPAPPDPPALRSYTGA